jgi:hypothetical protein
MTYGAPFFLCERIEGVSPSSTIEDKFILAKKSVNYPAFGELPLDYWIEQIYLHEQRHIEQIKEDKLLLDARH